MKVRPPTTKSGTVPDRLKVVMRPEEELTRTIDGKDYTVKVRPAMFTDADGKMDAALEWGRVWVSDNPDKKPTRYRAYSDTGVYVKPEVAEEPNKLRTWLQFWAIDERGEGGRAYKVIDREGRMFDMREDVVEESIFAGEFNNRLFTGYYLWVRVGSQMRLVRHESRLHKEMLGAKRRKALKKIPNKELGVGGVYRTRDGKAHVYLGRVPGKGTGKGLCFVQLGERWDGESETRSYQERWDRAKPCPNGVIPQWCFKASQSMVERVGTVDAGEWALE